MEYKVSQKVKDTFETLSSLESVKKGLEAIKKDQDRCINEQIELTLIEAPTFHEEKRAEVMKKKMEELGLEDVHIDRGGNVVGVRKGSGGGKRVLIEGHLDTVFPFGSVKKVEEKNGFLYAPGIGDDTRALAMLLSCIRGLDTAGIKTKGDLVFVATTREEGMGSLGGMKDFLDDNYENLDASISIDGGDIADITYEATGFKTYEVNFYGIGGHAYGAFGKMANPLHAAARAVAKIADIQVPAVPKTTYCVSNFHAGNDAGVHAIVPQATIKINMRSNQMEPLLKMKAEIYKAIEDGCREETERWGKDTITYDIHEYFNVPAGSLGLNDPIVEAAYAITKFLGKEPSFNEGGPTDAAFPICNGIPAVCLGSGDVETNSHSAENERFPIDGMWRGPQAAFLLAILCSGIDAKVESIL